MIEITKRTKSGDVFLTARCKAFSGEGVRANRILVDADGTVRVWDDVAGHYTTCHSIPGKGQQRLRRAAR